MEVLHISPVYNRRSIAKLGIIPSKISLPAHLESFKKDNMCTKDDKCVYSWLSCDKNEKFIRDMVFCNVWIDPRNDLADKSLKELKELEKIYGKFIDLDNCIDFRKLLNKNLYNYREMIFDVYCAIEDTKLDTYYIHQQYNDDNIFNTIHKMPDEYAHNDKRLVIFKKPLKNIKIIAQAKYYYDNKKYHIKVAKAI
jgi:hypothetical protein